MVGSLLEMLENARLHAGIQGGRGGFLLEQGRVHSAGAGEGDQHPARAKEFEGKQFNVLISPGGPRRLGSSREQLWAGRG